MAGSWHSISQKFDIIEVIKLCGAFLCSEFVVFFLIRVFGEIIFADSWLFVLCLILFNIIDVATSCYFWVYFLKQTCRFGSFQTFTILSSVSEKSISKCFIFVRTGIGHKGLNLLFQKAWLMLRGSLELLLPWLILIVPVFPIDYLLPGVNVKNWCDILSYQIEL